MVFHCAPNTTGAAIGKSLNLPHMPSSAADVQLAHQCLQVN